MLSSITFWMKPDTMWICIYSVWNHIVFKRVHNIFSQRPVGLVVWFSLRVREVPGSTPGLAPLLVFTFLILHFMVPSRSQRLQWVDCKIRNQSAPIYLATLSLPHKLPCQTFTFPSLPINQVIITIVYCCHIPRILHEIVVRCVIWYHLYNLKNLKSTHGGVLILITLLHGYFSRFLNCTNATKSCSASHIDYWYIIIRNIKYYSQYFILNYKYICYR